MASSRSRGMAGIAQQAFAGASRAWRFIWAPKNRGFTVLWILVFLTVVPVSLGLILRPSANIPPSAELQSPSFFLAFPGSPPPRFLDIDSYLEQTSNPATELVIDTYVAFPQHLKTVRWVMEIRNFTGYLCTAAPRGKLIPVPGYPGSYTRHGESPVPPTAEESFLQITLCWARNSPLSTTDAPYLSATLPAITTPVQAGTVERFLALNGTSLAGYALIGGIAPTQVSARSWIWMSSLGDAQSQALSVTPITASNLSELQSNTNDAFYSGILFGLGGGAIVSLFPVGLDAVDRRNKASQRSPDNGNPDNSVRSQTPGKEGGGHTQK